MQMQSSTQPGFIMLFRSINSFLPPGVNDPFPESSAQKARPKGYHIRPLNIHIRFAATRRESIFLKTQRVNWHKNTKNFGNTPFSDKKLSKPTVFVDLILRNCQKSKNFTDICKILKCDEPNRFPDLFTTFTEPSAQYRRHILQTHEQKIHTDRRR